MQQPLELVPLRQLSSSCVCLQVFAAIAAFLQQSVFDPAALVWQQAASRYPPLATAHASGEKLLALGVLPDCDIRNVTTGACLLPGPDEGRSFRLADAAGNVAGSVGFLSPYES